MLDCQIGLDLTSSKHSTFNSSTDPSRFSLARSQFIRQSSGPVIVSKSLMSNAE